MRDGGRTLAFGSTNLKIGRVHGYACVDEDTIAHRSYGYVIEYGDCPNGYNCVVSSSGDDGCRG